MKKSGIAEFTLTEIIIIVMIIGILATFGIPSYRQARINSIVRAKEKNIILTETAAKQYATERGLINGTVSYDEYYEYLEGCTASDGSRYDVGKDAFQKPDVTLDTQLTVDDCY